MKVKLCIPAAALAAILAGCAQPPGNAPAVAPPATNMAASTTQFHVPIVYNKLDNGLKVVLSPDHTSPTVVVGVYYNIGFRIEPKDRTGFAHLFEHLMFQGSQNLGKMEFIKLIQSNGGILNGSTRFDFTNYFEIVPAHTLQTMLWAEADRMRGLAITQDNLTNQQGVVKNEVRVNVLNAPYGGFPWLDLPQYANTNWYNAHNFYGDLKDIDAATLADSQQFFHTYYAPNNAVLVVTGDFNTDQAMSWVRQYFSGIAAVPQPPKADLTEPRQEQEKRVSKDDMKATRPALAIAYHTPAPDTPEFYALALLDQIVAQGNDSLLYQSLVQQKGLTGGVSSSLNPLGNMFNIDGPDLYEIWMFHDSDKSADQIVSAMDEQIETIRTNGIDPSMLARARTKMRSDLYDQIESLVGFGKADLLASFALFDDNPEKINQIIPRFDQVTPELIKKTAQEYLRPTNRTILTVVPKGATK